MIRLAYVFALSSALLLSGTGQSFAQSAAAQAVKERQELMKHIWPNYYRDIARAAREGTDIAALPAKATAAADAVKKFGTLFPSGSGREAVPDTRAKPEVFTQKAEFDAAVTALVTATNALGETAKSGNADAVKAQFAKVAEACGGCHGGPTKSGGKFRFEE